MKRDLFYAIAIALCGLVSFTSCTKDYDDDLRIQRELIENNEKELRALIDAYQVLVENTLEQMEIAYKNADDLIKQEMKAEFDAAKQRLTALETALDAAESNIAALASDLVTFKAAVNLDFQRINANIEAINARIDDVDQKITALDTRLTTVEAALADLKAWKTLAEAKLAELEKSQEADKAEIEALKTRIAAAEERISALEQQLAALTQAMNAADEALNKRIDDLAARMTSELGMQTTTLTELITQVQVALTDDMTQLRAEMQQFKAEMNAAFDEHKQAVDAEFEQIARQIEGILGQINEIYDGLSYMSDKITELDAMLNELTARLAGLASAEELKALTARIDALEQQLTLRDKELELMIGNNSDNIKTNKAEIAELRQQLLELEAGLKQRIADAIAEQLTSAMDTLVAQLTADYQAADEVLQALIDEINNTTIPAMETRLDTIEAFIQDMKNRIQSLKWIPDITDGSLFLNAQPNITRTMFESAVLTGELYVVCNAADIIDRILSPTTVYTIEMLVNSAYEELPSTRALIESPFSEPVFSAGDAPNTLKMEMSYLQTSQLWGDYGEYLGKRFIIREQIALKITDDKGNAIMTDFIPITIGYEPYIP